MCRSSMMNESVHGLVLMQKTDAVGIGLSWLIFQNPCF